MKGTDFIAEFLAKQGVTSVFEMSGGMITHLLDSLHRGGKVKIVSVHHEQAAAFAADGFGRMTGVPGVALATSGPGATNLLTGIGSCFFDSSPAVFITGQVNRHEQKGDRAIRQLGFQETDIVAMARPIVKAAIQVRAPEEIPRVLEEAFALALAGRPGPVLVDIPMDVQRGEVTAPVRRVARPAPVPIDPACLQACVSELAAASAPLLLVGGGIRAAGATKLLREVAHRFDVPVVNSLLAVDALPASDPLRVGMLGSYGNRWVNLAMDKSDFVLVVGSRLDIRQTGADVKAWQGKRRIWHVDAEAGEINNRLSGCEAIVGDAAVFLSGLFRAPMPPLTSRARWKAEIAALRAQWPDTKELAGVAGINPNQFMHALSLASGQAVAYCVDVGQHQMWAAQSLRLSEGQSFLTSGGMGSMGFALPAAIGAAFAEPGKPIVVVAGDGGFQSNIQEIQTVVRNKLPLKMVILNNQSHGMVRQFQESYFEGRFQSTVWGYSAPDFARVAEGYGLKGRTLESLPDVADALKWLWADPLEPALLQVMIDQHANAYPKMAFGRGPTEMEPFAKPIDMEGT